ncbi:MAG TPA: hypothetical protein VIM96_00855 [Pseudomonadales bacterium]
MSRRDSVLIPTDEGLHHQITDTFGSVAQADRSWAEKICASIGRKDGKLQVGFGLGKYINRNVMDAYGGVSRGKEQWTVRASRQLWPEPDTTITGPLRYHIVEPFKKVRFILEENAIQPIAFEIVFDGTQMPPFMENHEFRRQLGGYRVENDLCRYHQVGVPEGWIKVEGKVYEVSPRDWYCTRDHSWGLRYGVGLEPADIQPGIDSSQFPMQFLWSPMRLMDKATGRPYTIHHFYLEIPIPGVPKVFHGAIEYPDGRQELLTDMVPELRFDPKNRRLLGGVLHFTTADGHERPVTVEVMGDTGFHLGTGLYFGLDGHHHGEWRGEMHMDGEYLRDCSDVETAKRIHQIRDCIIKVTDGANEGFANYQTIVTGAWPALNLVQEGSFL